MDKNIIETPEFWEQVKLEFAGEPNLFLCNASPLFESQWHTQEDNIRTLAKEFISQSDVFSDFKCEKIEDENSNNYSILLYKYSFTHYMQVRVAFLDWCIQKFSPNAETV